MPKRTDEENVVNIFDGKPFEENKYTKIYGLLESNNEKFNSLVKQYQQACNQRKMKDQLVKRAIAIEIQNYPINQPIELIIKMSVLERELGFKNRKRTRDVIYDDLMFTMFKRSLVNFVETTLYGDLK